MQAEARERIRKARFKLEAGASVGAADVYGVANWDHGLALELVERAEEQNGGETPEDLRTIAASLRFQQYRRISEKASAEGQGAKAETAFGMAMLQLARDADVGETFHSAFWKPRSFDRRYDDALAATLESPGKPLAAGPAAPNLSALLGGGPSADSLSSIGLGFTGTRRDSQETLELLRRIADSSDRAARKDSGLK